ncbi:MAG: peptidoglycan DD-metalloendopeptidase family protein [Methylococcaceae bacterium]|nr:peptidoglycan DD-metalloendopeptidase family protein [Methylococcaceae bacterium]
MTNTDIAILDSERCRSKHCSNLIKRIYQGFYFIFQIDPLFDFYFSRSVKVLPILVLLFISFYTTGCTTTNNYAPVRPYQRDLVNNNKIYVVKKGDTLYSIGFRSGHGYRRLSRWNKISPPYKLQVGQKLKLFESKQKLRYKIRKNNKKTTIVKKRTPSQKKTIPAQKTSTNSNDNKKMLKLYWQWPLRGRILKYFSSGGSKGIDINGKIGQKVRAASSGKVVYSGSGLKGYGNLLIIKHNYMYLSAYANNRRLLVKEGQIVKKGQVIAEVGRMGGKKTSLHFEIRKNGNPVNPLNYLPKK